MSTKLYSYKGVPVDDYRGFLCDTRADIANLPSQSVFTTDYPVGVPAGSSALVLADFSVWVLSNADTWVEDA